MRYFDKARKQHAEMLTYCMNVHPGESLEDQIRNIETLPPQVRNALPQRAICDDGNGAFPLGLRFSAIAAAEFCASAEARARLCKALAEKRLAPFTMNAFPFGAFHGTAVKENAYRPTWRETARVEYTIAAAQTLAALMPENIARGSVSTCPLTWKGFSAAGANGANGAADSALAIRNVGVALEAFRRIHEESGKFLILSMEPEPGCFPETTDETIEVINAIRASVPEALHPHLGVCFDTAHLAVEFEDLADSLRKFAAAGIQIGKVQLSAALECDDTPEARADLARYAEGTYLHQTAVCAADSFRFFNDLPEFLDSTLSAVCGESAAIVRSHFHIPLHESPAGQLRSTTPLLRDERFLAALRDSGCEQLEVETYTWDVWRRCSGSAEDICSGIAREISAMRESFDG